ncbi:alpha/beta fold hydrolase [Actinomadura sp. K4S16]|uniref:alpha/beta fold hydrolase n=1 Tax=Actinomadura sp. K4S16 TaxID=1316147 RepID=UPI00190F5F64|nr:alpha/beta hydrolase [Actinomadura sp. K4S16]
MEISRARRLHKAGLLALIGMLVLTGISATQASATSTALSGKPKPTVVLVHGAWADSSGWAKVTRGLQAKGYQVLAPPTPLRGLREDSDYLAAFLRDRTTGPVVLVGHSYGGAVITNAARSDKDVEALVYINAFVPDEGDSILGLLDPNHELDPADLFDFVQYPGAPAGDNDLYLKQNVFPDAIANGIPARDAAAMAAAQRPVTLSALTAGSGAPAWKSLPSFYLLGTQDHIVPPALQSTMAGNAGAKITRVRAGHLPLITNPHTVEALIVQADRSTPAR